MVSMLMNKEVMVTMVVEEFDHGSDGGAASHRHRKELSDQEKLHKRAKNRPL